MKCNLQYDEVKMSFEMPNSSTAEDVIKAFCSCMIGVGFIHSSVHNALERIVISKEFNINNKEDED